MLGTRYHHAQERRGIRIETRLGLLRSSDSAIEERGVLALSGEAIRRDTILQRTGKIATFRLAFFGEHR